MAPSSFRSRRPDLVQEGQLIQGHLQDTAQILFLERGVEQMAAGKEKAIHDAKYTGKSQSWWKY